MRGLSEVRRRALLAGGSALLLVVLLASPVRALDARTGEAIVVAAGQVIDDDLYAFAETVTIDGTVRGDVVAAGRVVVVNGTIEGGLIAAGQTVSVNGSVRDTARVAGQAVLLDGRGRIGRDLVAAGYSIEHRTGSSVGRDLVAFGYQALLAGAIVRDVRAGLGALEVRGSVGGNVDVSVGDTEDGGAAMLSPPPAVAMPRVRPGLTVTETARIDGALRYTAPREFPIRGAVGRGVFWAPWTEEEKEAPRADPWGAVADSVRRLVALGLAGLLLVGLAPAWTRRLTETLETQPLPSLGWGVIGWFGAAGLALGLFVGMLILAGVFGVATLGSLAGLTVALGLLLEAILGIWLLVFAGFIAPVLVSVLAGRWLLQRASPTWVDQPAAPLLVGLPLFVLLTAIPVLGGLVGVLAALAALGAVWIWSRDLRGAPPAGGGQPPAAGLPPPTAAR